MIRVIFEDGTVQKFTHEAEFRRLIEYDPPVPEGITPGKDCWNASGHYKVVIGGKRVSHILPYTYSHENEM